MSSVNVAPVGSGGGSSSCSFSSSGSDTLTIGRQDVDVELRVSGSSGSINVRGSAEVVDGDSIRIIDLSQNISALPDIPMGGIIQVKGRIKNEGRLDSILNEARNGMLDRFNDIMPDLPSSPGKLLPDELDGYRRMGRYPLKHERAGANPFSSSDNLIQGQNPVDINASLSWPAPTIPLPDPSVVDLPDITVQFKVMVVKRLTNWGYLRTSAANIEVTVPGCVFLNIRELDINDCLDIHGRLAELAEEIGDEAPRIKNQVESAESRIQSHIGDLQSPMGGGSSIDVRNRAEEVRSSMRDIRGNVGDIKDSFDGSRLQEMEEDATEAIETATDAQAMMDKIDEFRSRMRGIAEDCAPELLALADEWHDKFKENIDGSRIRQLRDLAQRLRNIVERILSAKDIDSDRPEFDGVCRDPPRALSGAVSSLESSVERQRNMQVTRRNPERVNSLKSEVQSLESRIASSLDGADPCRGELIGRVRDAKSELDRVSVVAEVQVPCSNRFPDVEAHLNRLEDAVEEIDEKSDEEDLERVESLEETAAELVEGVDNNRCRRQFERRIRRADRKINTRVSPIRLSRDIIGESRERRRKLLEKIVGGDSFEGSNVLVSPEDKTTL